jgi:hypothetical protein
LYPESAQRLLEKLSDASGLQIGEGKLPLAVADLDAVVEMLNMTSIHHMSCPTALLHAPIEIVRALLTEPSRWDEFFDLHDVLAAPPGIAVVGSWCARNPGRDSCI